MTHKHGRIDGNHTQIGEALRAIGASVVSLADVGNGCPDLLVGYRGITLLLEVKNGIMPPSKKKLTADESKFFDEWRGNPPHIVYNADDAVRVMTVFTSDDDGLPF